MPGYGIIAVGIVRLGSHKTYHLSWVDTYKAIRSLFSEFVDSKSLHVAGINDVDRADTERQLAVIESWQAQS